MDGPSIHPVRRSVVHETLTGIGFSSQTFNVFSNTEDLILVHFKNSNSPFGQSASRIDYVRPRLFYDVNK